MNLTPDPIHIESLQAANVVIGGTQVVILDNQRIDVPTLSDMVAYLAGVRRHYRRWADEPEGTLNEADAANGDIFIETRALPMRVAQYAPQRMEGEDGERRDQGGGGAVGAAREWA